MRKRLYKAGSDTNNLRLEDAVSIFNLGGSTIKRLARESGAVLKIGRITRYRRDILEKYIQDMQEKRA